MLNINIKPNRVNKTRKNLLNLTQKDFQPKLTQLNTKVNSCTLKEIQQRYENDTYFEMKEKKLFTNDEYEIISKLSIKPPRRLSDKIAKIKLNFSRKNSLIAVNNNSERRLSRRGISDMKFAFFRRNTLHINLPLSQKSDIVNIEDVVEYININHGFVNNKKTLERTEKGFRFLNDTVNKYKIKKFENSFEELKKILCLKENIDEDSLIEEEGVLSSRTYKSKRKFFITSSIE
jgi:hypothetical protein